MKYLNKSLFLSLVLLYGVSSFTPFLNAADKIPQIVTCRKTMHEKGKLVGLKHIRHIDQKKILVEQKKITFLLRQHKTVRLTMQAGAVLVVIYYMYSWFGSRVEDDGTVAVPTASKESLMLWLKNMPGRAGNALTTWDTYLTVGKWVGQVGAYAVINKVFGDFITATNHSNTISWFTRTRVPFEKTITELGGYAQLLENNEVAGDELVYTQRALVSTANTLITDVESVCAFMQYKLKTSDIPVDKKGEVSSLITYVIEQTNMLVDVLEKERVSIDRQVLVSHIDAFKDKFQREVKRFGRIDEEKDWEEEMRELGTDLNSLIARNNQTPAIKKKTKTPDLVKA